MKVINMSPYQVQLWAKGLRASVALEWFVTERLSYATHAVGLKDRTKEVISVVLIAANGAPDAALPSILAVAPPYAQEPTIMAVYTRWYKRRLGFGMKALKMGIAYCREQGFPKVRITATAQIARLVARLPQQDQDYLTVFLYDPIFDKLEDGR